jgi:hypothetical protein
MNVTTPPKGLLNPPIAKVNPWSRAAGKTINAMAAMQSLTNQRYRSGDDVVLQAEMGRDIGITT